MIRTLQHEPRYSSMDMVADVGAGAGKDRTEGNLMDGMFLDDEELRSMTHRVQRSAQAKMLRSMGIAFKQRADGTLAVLRAHVEKEFGASAERKAKPKEFQPNWSGLNA